MKTKLSFFLLTFTMYYSIFNCFSQAGEWVWIHGDSLPNQPGNFGTQGVPGPNNNSPSFYEPCEWTDLNGNFWLFGGINGTGQYGDLWKYNPATNEWAWMKGSGIVNDPGSYGTQGIPSLTNNPRARRFASASWLDNAGNLWMFGGYANGGLNDLWKYDIATNEWTWMKGSNAPGQTGIYGIQGVAAPNNTPGNRWECSAAWRDDAGDLWLFGGLYTSGFFNDMWRYNISSNQWAWMKGANFVNQQGTYGMKGIEDSLNTPGSRGAYAHWKDTNNKLWLFAGLGPNSSLVNNDLWRFNITTNNWSWISGDSAGNSEGIYGVKCITDSINIPKARIENRTAWTDQNNNFWAFGGVHINFDYYLNDLWMYCVKTNNWTWIDGDSISNPQGSWNVLGLSSPLNKPNGRAGSVGWTDNNGHLYFFGGYGNGNAATYNDLWKYTIDSTCGVCPINTSVQEQTDLSSTIEIFPNPADKSVVISSESGENNKAQLSVTDMLGDELYRCTLRIPNFRLLTASFPNGIYIVKASSQKGVFQKKLVVNH